MSLSLFVDEDSQDKILVARLKAAGHNVVTASDAGLLGRPDNEVLAYSVETNSIVLTRNCEDFCSEAAMLKASGRHHHGILLRYEENDPSRDMNYNEIVNAIENVDEAVSTEGLVLTDLELSLSYYRYQRER